MSLRIDRQALYRATHRPLAPISARFRTLAFRRGRDETDAFARRSALVLAPHPDDETLGCGVTILRKRALGTRVRVAIATDGRGHGHSRVISPDEVAALRRREALAACAQLGVNASDLLFLGFEDGHLEDSAGQLYDRIRDIIRAEPPQEILVPSLADRHPDHRALSEAVHRLIREGEIECAVYEYPIWYWDRYPWTHQPKGLTDALWHFLSDPILACLGEPPALVRTEGLVERKRSAIQAYRTQSENLTGEPTWWTFPNGFIETFLGSHEIFFPIHKPTPA